MNSEKYQEQLGEIASTFLLEANMEKWKRENPDSDFYDFMSDEDRHDQIHELIDSYGAQDWKSAIEVLQVSKQNADHVDSGLYEGANWKKILVIIAFEVLRWDVEEKMKEMFENDEIPDCVVSIPTTQRQIGFFPGVQKFRIPKSIERSLVVCKDWIKILEWGGQDRTPSFSVIFDGPHTETKSFYVIECRRVYTQGGPDAKIEDDLKRCYEMYGVKKVKGGPKCAASASLETNNS